MVRFAPGLKTMLKEPLPVTVIPFGSVECIVRHVSVRPFEAVMACAIPRSTKRCADSLTAAIGSLYVARMSVIEAQQQRRCGIAPMISTGTGSMAPENRIVSRLMGAQRNELLGPQATVPDQDVLDTCFGSYWMTD